MAERTVTIRISAQDRFSSVFKQYQQAIGQAADDTKQLDKASEGAAKGGLTGLNNTLNNLMGVFASIKILGVAGDLVQLGEKANRTESAFDALSGGVANAQANLALMRSATGGIVADLDLMTAGNKLFQMGLAQTGEQASQLAATAIRLGQALGRDVNESFADFSQMLAQGSIMRLDNFGLSSARVKERMAELKEEFPELDRQARFVQATMEEADKAVNRLGNSFNAAQTPIARLETAFQNFKANVGQSLADTVNTALTTMGQLSAIMDATGKDMPTVIAEAILSPEAFDEQMIIDNAKAFAEKWSGEFGKVIGKGWFPSDFDPADVLQRIEEAKMRLGVNAAPDDLVQMVGEDLWYSEQNIDRLKYAYSLILTNSKTVEEENKRVQQSELARFQAMMNANVAQNVALNNNILGQFNLSGHTVNGGAVNSLNNYGFDLLGGGGRQTPQDYANDKLFQYQHNADEMKMGKFLDPAAFDEIKARFEELQRLNEQGLISDESLAKAEAFKDQAEAAANAFKNMSLTDIFGQSSGGMQGQIGDMVIAEMRKNGAKPEEIANAQRMFDLGSGRETDASLAMKEKVAPMIASLPPDQQEKAIENINAFLEFAAKMNMSPERIANLLPGAAGFTNNGAGGSFTVLPGQGVGQVAAANGLTNQQVMNAAGNGQYIYPGTYNYGTGYAPIPNFNPQAYAMGYNVPMGGAPGTNPFVSTGLAGAGLFPDTGQNAGAADPAQKMADMKNASDDVTNNMQEMNAQMEDLATKGDAFTKVLDEAAKARDMTFTVNLKDNTNGFLTLLLNSQQFGTLTMLQSNGLGVRDGGGNSSQLGTVSTASSRPGFSQRP